ncbi:ATP-binding cassette domain-containing protein [Candidatus Woesearchaeota archaeon]|nr:ATP-binding cassette domain-containing protein [Candidatus Woesearchaeota archaeon]
MILNIKNLEKKFGTNILFENASLQLNEGDKMAFVGQNGRGKTTLIKCISGDEDFQGSIELTPETKIAVMEQQKTFDGIAETFREYLKQKKNKINKKIKELEEEMGKPEVYENPQRFDKLLHEHALLCSRITEDIEEDKLKTNLQSLNFPLELLDQPISSLSGGEKTALRLSECLGKEANLLILDEPTNHLDFKAINWFEEWIRNSGKTILVITHDRKFLDNVVNRVAEIENKNIAVYKTNYTGYLQERIKHRIEMHKQHQATEKERQRLMDSSKQKRIWASKNGNKSMRMQADNLERRAEELPKIEDPSELEKKYEFQCKEGKKSSDMIFEIKNMSKSFGTKKVLANVNLLIHRGQKIALIGMNGIGKSTLLKILNKKIAPDSGEANQGQNLKIGYFDQESKNFNPEEKVETYMLDLYGNMHDNQIQSMARKFGFEHDLRKKKISALSGGEKARLQLLKLMLEEYNVLLLDEPTNHLDLELREALEKALKNWEGTILFVSHDRFFIDRVATHIMELEEGKIKIMEGNYSNNFS